MTSFLIYSFLIFLIISRWPKGEIPDSSILVTFRLLSTFGIISSGNIFLFSLYSLFMRRSRLYLLIFFLEPILITPRAFSSMVFIIISAKRFVEIPEKYIFLYPYTGFLTEINHSNNPVFLPK